jgi:hypothetical protein
MEIYKAGADVMDRVKKLVTDYHPHLLLILEDIGVVFREKAVEKGGKVMLGATKKAPPILSVLTDKQFNYKFIIELGEDVWGELTSSQQTALLDHHLCAMRVEEDAESGTMKCSIRPPDFVGYREEVERHGMWRPMDDDTLSVIEEMFGKKAEEIAESSTASETDDDVQDIVEALSG